PADSFIRDGISALALVTGKIQGFRDLRESISVRRGRAPRQLTYDRLATKEAAPNRPKGPVKCPRRTLGTNSFVSSAKRSSTTSRNRTPSVRNVAQTSENHPRCVLPLRPSEVACPLRPSL